MIAQQKMMVVDNESAVCLKKSLPPHYLNNQPALLFLALFDTKVGMEIGQFSSMSSIWNLL